jgi:hypothetical protein
MILCEWDAPEGHPGQCCVHLYAHILSTSFTSVSIFSVCCYSSVSISVVGLNKQGVVQYNRVRKDDLSNTPHTTISNQFLILL